MKKIEEKLNEALVKNAPVKLPNNAKKSLVQWFPWIAVILGVLQLWAVLSLWRLGHLANDLINYANSISAAYGQGQVSVELGLFYWLSLGLLAVTGVLMVAAFPGLKAKEKRGWNMLFYASLINFFYGIARLFTDVGAGFASLVWAAVGTVIGLYFLFQVREYYTGAKRPVEPAQKV